jgi:hypothetical protein
MFPDAESLAMIQHYLDSIDYETRESPVLYMLIIDTGLPYFVRIWGLCRF